MVFECSILANARQFYSGFIQQRATPGKQRVNNYVLSVAHCVVIMIIINIIIIIIVNAFIIMIILSSNHNVIIINHLNL